MSFIQNIRTKIRTNETLRAFVAFRVVGTGLFDNTLLNMRIGENFQKRIDIVLSCPDNEKIDTIPAAGQVKGGVQTMHNGLKIYLGSYYGPEVAQMLYKNKGIHEPQEEYIFQEVLKNIPPKATMIEMGAFWSFYSLWFNEMVEDATNFMIEPEVFNMKCGQRNFKLNNKKGHFTNAFIGKESGQINGTAVVCVDDFVEKHQIEFVDILHSDIQGFEHDMLEGARRTFNANKIGYCFISTHNNPVHQQCIDFLKAAGFVILIDVDLDDTYSEDGLIVARNLNYLGLNEGDVVVSHLSKMKN